jgi:hypothetical protein
MDFKDHIISEVADTASRKLTRRVIVMLQRMQDGMQSGEDAGLANVWDEVCVHVQGEAPICWDAYEETIKQIIAHEAGQLPGFVKQALWLQTDAGFDWCWESANGEESSPPLCSDEEMDEAIADYILRAYIVEKAEEWSNARIREYLDRQYQGHFT